LILDDTSPHAVALDTTIPPSSAAVHRTLIEAWPRLAGRIRFVAGRVDAFEILPGDVVMSIHACGRLTDVVLERAVAARARVAVVPCCHDAVVYDAGGMTGWMEPALAIDVMRAQRLATAGYRVWTQAIPAAITPKNRLLIGAPWLRLNELRGGADGEIC